VNDWALVTTVSNTEHLVGEELLSLSIPYVYFKYPRRRSFRGRVIDDLVPAFPRYLFVPFTSAWEVAREVARVTGIVKLGDEVARIPGRVIDRMCARCHGDVLPEIDIPSPFKRGEEVVISGHGPLFGQRALYQEPSSHPGKALCLVDWMQRFVPVDIDLCDLSSLHEVQVKKREENKRKKHGKRRRGGRNRHRVMLKAA
jgi:hypothetical protein